MNGTQPCAIGSVDVFYKIMVAKDDFLHITEIIIIDLIDVAITIHDKGTIGIVAVFIV